jgi:hypothetical protein
MFDHARVQRLLSSYYDGELTPDDTIRIEQHLQGCASCRKEYQQLAVVANAMRHLPRLEAPLSLARMIRRRIDEEVLGMVPMFRDELLSCRSRPVLVPAISLGALVTVILLTGVLVLGLYQGRPFANRSVAALGAVSQAPGFLHEEMTSPRFRDGCVQLLPFTEMERGEASTLLTLASIDQSGAVRGLHVIDHSGDEQMLARTLEVLRSSGFEPARVGDQTVAVNFLYLFTTTEVRLSATHSISELLGIRRLLT